MFWKKKQEEVPKVEEKKSGEGMYDCIGINYLDVIEIDGEDLDSVKEELFEKFKQMKKVFSRNDIEKITEKFGYDIWKSFIWVELPILQLNAKFSVNAKYRWLGIKKEYADKELYIGIENPEELLKSKLNNKEFYNMVQIQNVSAEVGFSVFDRCNWQLFTETTRIYPTETFVYYTKSNGVNNSNNN
jgi:hypothetical protein